MATQDFGILFVECVLDVFYLLFRIFILTLYFQMSSGLESLVASVLEVVENLMKDLKLPVLISKRPV